MKKKLDDDEKEIADMLISMFDRITDRLVERGENGQFLGHPLLEIAACAIELAAEESTALAKAVIRGKKKV